MTGRAREQVWQKTVATLGESITINHAVKWNATLLQFSYNIDGTPDPADVFELRKESFQDPAIDVVIRRFTPNTDGQYAICNEHFEFMKGDRLVVNFANTADEACGFEAIFTEGG
jgi:hypothetical protein